MRHPLYLRGKVKTAFARHLRKRQTPGEKAIWRKVRNRRFLGLKFRRQVPVGPYIVDFLCVEKMLVLEIDGSSHFLPGAAEYDQRRDAYLREKGFHVLRFSNSYATREPGGVLEYIAEHLELL